MESICRIKDCKNKHLAKGFCSKHYYRNKRGLDVSAKTIYDKRPAKICGDITYIELGNKRGTVTIDSKHSHLDMHNWSLTKDGYASTSIGGKMVKMHHLIIGKPIDGLVVDHINRDKLDNRLKNLRHVTQKVNMRNVGLLKNNTTGVTGVTYDKAGKRWIAQAFYGYKRIHGGRYKTFEEAVVARKALEEQYA